jgi:hypothetical protein
MSTVTDLAPAAPVLDRQGAELAQAVEGIAITDHASFGDAVEMLKTVKAYLRKVADLFDPIDAAQIAARKTTIEQRKKLEQHALTAEKLLKDRMAAYEREVERQRQAAELAAQKERERLEAEARAQAEAEQKRLQAEEDERRLAEAVKAEASGDVESARRLLEEPTLVPTVMPAPVFMPPVDAPSAPRAAGVTFTTTYTAEVTSLIDLVKAVAAGQQPVTLLLANQVALNGMARAQKLAMKVPGVRVKETRGVAART